MEVYRLVREKYALPLSGKGAAIKGGRWNSIGFELIYTAQNRSLAMAEVAAHFSLATLPEDYRMLTIFIPDDLTFDKIHEKDLPADWKNFPPSNATQKIGEQFILKGSHCLLFAPSAITKGDNNILINPSHGDFKYISIVQVEPFPLNKRIFKL